MPESEVLPRRLMLAIALVQGLLLFYLYKTSSLEIWPSSDPLWAFPLWTVAVAVPVLLLLSLVVGTERRLAIQVTVFAVPLVLVAMYVGWQATPAGEFPVSSLVFVFVSSMSLACFKGLMYLQQRSSGQGMTYDVLFTYSWRNFLTLALSLLFVGIFWLILNLWGLLFKTIGVDFFQDLFRKDWFLFPVLSTAHGLAVIIFRNLTRVIDSITRLLQGLIKLLLPVVVAVAVIFLATLPVVGLDELWSTGRGTALLLWLLALTLFFTNAVYQDGRGESAYATPVHRGLYIGLLATPVISLLSLYGLWQRVEQYGWTVGRCWAVLVWLILTLFAIGYVWGIVTRRDNWTQQLARVNTVMGLVVLALMLLANSPIMDFRKVALASQLERVETGVIGIEDFDFWYTRQTLARPGFLAFESMKERYADSRPEVIALLENPVRQGRAQTMPAPLLWERMSYRPEPFEVPQDLRSKIATETRYYPPNTEPVLMRLDLNEDGQDEYALVFLVNEHFSGAKLYYRDDSQWVTANLSMLNQNRSDVNFPDAIRSGEIGGIPPKYPDLKIGDVVLRAFDSR